MRPCGYTIDENLSSVGLYSLDSYYYLVGIPIRAATFPARILSPAQYNDLESTRQIARRSSCTIVRTRCTRGVLHQPRAVLVLQPTPSTQQYHLRKVEAEPAFFARLPRATTCAIRGSPGLQTTYCTYCARNITGMSSQRLLRVVRTIFIYNSVKEVFWQEF